MTAHFYCWEPSLEIDPMDSDFRQQLSKAQGQEEEGASPKLLAFVASLQAKHLDLMHTDDTPWATGPLVAEISGRFINIPVSWSWYTDALIEFIVETAHSHGLHCHDPQSGKLYESLIAR